MPKHHLAYLPVREVPLFGHQLNSQFGCLSTFPQRCTTYLDNLPSDSLLRREYDGCLCFFLSGFYSQPVVGQFINRTYSWYVGLVNV